MRYFIFDAATRELRCWFGKLQFAMEYMAENASIICVPAKNYEQAKAILK